MPGSYRMINYSLRPAKSVERKMLTEAMNRLSVFERIEDYRYIGFGSTFFTDFLLFHKSLGFKHMDSIEKDAFAKGRFSFNKPYSCIESYYEHSNDALPKIDLSQKNVLWLDYDDKLLTEMFADINTFFSSCGSGSMFIMSLNAEPDEVIVSEQGEKSRLMQLEDRIGSVKVPAGTKESDLSRKNLNQTYLKIINNEIQEAISKRNGGIEDVSQKLSYNQLFNFKYADGADMFTTGGVIYQQSDQDKFQKARFEDLAYIKTGIDPFKIEIPNLTLKEIKYIESYLPQNINLTTGKLKGVKPADDPDLPPSDVLKYTSIYRYFPNYTEAIL
ncbi:hypothetical protein ABIC45_003258 [Mucilaginibacter rubeus]|uniref:O-methyltransferase n=1 Tax=Mucilaginibacter rubeus TaxID=2027860 RepID=UPI003398D021